MAIVFALISALAYGLSDFIGGLASRKASPWSVAVVVQAASAVATTFLALFFPGDFTTTDLLYGAVGGIGAGVGVGFLFRGLGSGRMSVVAPVSAVGAAVVPVTVGLLTGERPSLLITLGILAALPGIWLVASGEHPPDSEAPVPSAPARGGLVDGLLAGLGFGTMFAAVGQIPDTAGLWPLALAQTVSTVAAAGLATALGAAWWPISRDALRAAPAGLLGATAVVAFLASTHLGLLTVSAVLASLYPAATILLAMSLLHERIHRSQAIGLALCGLTVALTAAG